MPPAPSTPIMPPGFTDPSPSENGSPDSNKTATPTSPSQPPLNPTPHEDDGALLQKCLDAVIPICNSPEFRELLDKFRNIGGVEKNRYSPFVEFTNYVLELLAELELPQLRDPSDYSIVLHVNNGKTIRGYNGSNRTPDLAIVPLASAKRANPGKGTTWVELAKHAKHHPKRAFSWPDVLSAFEFKRAKASIKTDIPENYTSASPPKPVPHHLLDGVDLASVSGTSDASQLASTGSSLTGSSSASSHASTEASDPNAPEPRNHRSSVQEERDHVHSPVPISPDTKRQRDGLDPEEPGESSKRKRPRQEAQTSLVTKEAIVQGAVYGSEMLTGSIGRTHAINMLVIDDIVWMWWYDRQGAIQSQGINFIVDAPRFLAVLLAFQRFTLADWGFMPALTPQSFHLPSEDQTPSTTSQKLPTIHVTGPNGPNHQIPITLHDTIYQAYCLFGRGTSVLNTTGDFPELSGLDLVVKIYWPNMHRVNEATIVDDAIRGVSGVENHLPWVIGFLDLCSTEPIRKKLGFHLNAKGVFRVCRVVVFERLEPITNLKGEAFLRAWIECVRCHHLIWQAGIHHRDLSVRNLMVRTKGGKKFGVVNDWDLSFSTKKSDKPTEHTATMPFLSLDLLWNPDIEVNYRHALEVFTWILVWVFMCLENCDEAVPSRLKGWQTGDYKGCYNQKVGFISNHETFQPTPDWQNMAGIPKALLDLLSNNRAQRLSALRLTNVPLAEEPDFDHLRNFLERVRAFLPSRYHLPDSPAIPNVEKPNGL